MTKLSISGVLFIVVAGVMFLFRQISGLMGNPVAEPLAIVDLVAPEKLNWIDSLSFWRIDDFLNMVVLAPLYVLLIIVGVIILIISGFRK